MSDSKEALIIVGRFGRPRGVKGDITVISFTDPAENIFDYHPWLIQKKDQWIPIEYSLQGKTSDRFFVSLENITDRDLVAAFTNSDIAIYKHLLPVLKEEEYYWHELIGMKVFNLSGVYLGKITELLATGSNDVLIVEGDKKYLIPYLLKRFIIEINAAEGRTIVDWQESD